MRPMLVGTRQNADMDETAAALAPRLHQFVAVARAEHMTHAADEIGVPQSTLSRGIARLEADLGVMLFVRSGRTVRLTREGRMLLRHAERALAELVAGTREILGDADALHGRVGLAFLTTLGAAAVPRLLRDFRAVHPGVRMELVSGAHGLLLERLRSGDADLALTSPLPDGPGFASAALGEEEVRLIVGRTGRSLGSGVLCVRSEVGGGVCGDQVGELVAGGTVGDGWAPAVGVDLADAGLKGVEAGRQGAHAQVGADVGEE